ncbi:ribosomal-processing cysteine protease Prp [Lactiplantibacillus fabifermentans]|uniref:Ribosomal processing cysteine protease Prp n=2 Tax=Lactiplantibacillus fabifermentans TaxID=483011 RepID=A0A0R2NQ02_9LACO|nr:ribosomal-processing cysteine protease Prp [Lactiplantibacillus fabifermentans]ETY74516.1 ribosomal protein [Lactiplantibacillus fabifermentans T30PCM01]KRO27732.1 ribosomal protein [Lactiplantibacillus fabifermentans DSM 21115]
MIQATISRNGAGLITGFKLTGHADSGAYGQDIVCAAVSVLAISTINGIEQVAHLQPAIQSDETNGGLLIADFTKLDLANDQLQTLLASFTLGLNDVAANYGSYIRVHEQTK